MGDTAGLMRKVFKAWARKDLASFSRCLADNFSHTIHVPMTVSNLAGPCIGKSVAAARLEAISRSYDILAYEVGPIMTSKDGKRAAAQVAVRYRHIPSGILLETEIGYFAVLHEDKLVRLDEYHDVDKLTAFTSAAWPPATADAGQGSQ